MNMNKEKIETNKEVIRELEQYKVCREVPEFSPSDRFIPDAAKELVESSKDLIEAQKPIGEIAYTIEPMASDKKTHVYPQELTAEQKALTQEFLNAKSGTKEQVKTAYDMVMESMRDVLPQQEGSAGLDYEF